MTPSGRIINLAGSVFVEALKRNGQVFNLPAEFAGVQGQIAGLEQFNAVLIPRLRNAGIVQITIIVGGQRSNTVTSIFAEKQLRLEKRYVTPHVKLYALDVGCYSRRGLIKQEHDPAF